MTIADALPTTPESLWTAAGGAPRHPALTSDLEAEICVVGAGIVGLTCALELAERGHDVVVLEGATIGAGTTGHTTGKITALHGLIYDELQRNFGDEAAGVYATAQEDGLGHIRATVVRHAIDCSLRERSAYTYVTDPRDVELVEREVSAAQVAGLAAAFVSTTPLPYPVAAAIRLDHQAEFDAGAYLHGLADAFVAAGGRIFEESRSTGLDELGGPTVQVGDHKVRAQHVVVASHMPYLDRGAFFVRLTAKRSYAIAFESAAPSPDGMFISAGRGPTRSIRSHFAGGGEVLVLGGEGHNAGEQGDRTPAKYAALLEFAREHFAPTQVTHRWSSQDLSPADGLPYVGGLTPISRRVHVAAGFRKWGLSGGTAAALALVERIEGERTPFAKLTDAWRITPRRSAKGLIAEGTKDARHMIGDRLRTPDDGELEALAPGEGALLRHGGEVVAASRDLDGQLHAVSPVCTHLGCRVLWNAAECSWDCPCHGSRFAPDGEVLEGPATRALADRLSDDG